MGKILICNHKMFLTKDEAANLAGELEDIDVSKINFIVCPSYLNFNLFEKYSLGAQNCFYMDRGSYTGEISPYDLSLRGIRYAIVGHSDRRVFETDDIINKKVKACINNSLIPIICIGESKLDKELMKTSKVLKDQIKRALSGVTIKNEDQIMIAYEPIYKINGNEALSKSEIIDTFKFLKKVMEELDITNYKLLYGGSVNGNNIKNIDDEMIDGFLVGGASVNSSELKKIIKCIE